MIGMNEEVGDWCSLYCVVLRGAAWCCVVLRSAAYCCVLLRCVLLRDVIFVVLLCCCVVYIVSDMKQNSVLDVDCRCDVAYL